VIARPELAEDPRFASNDARVRNRSELIPLLQDAFRARPVDAWLRALERAGVPCAPVRSLDEVFASPEGRAMVQDVADRVRGPLRLVANPIRLSGGLLPVRRPPPLLGKDTDQVMTELD
jgi:crotonobetainyl-CoA:carnitine CoA-transferase CaiB-like acyl-CoA transferase